MFRALVWSVLLIVVGCWLVSSALDAIANRVVDRIEQRIRERRSQRRLP